MLRDLVGFHPGRRHFLKTGLGALMASFVNDVSYADDANTPTIVIDPGHGGHDSGAIGQSGTLEKELTLEAALRLKDKLAENSDYRILLTREKDIFIPLIDRVRFAQRNKAHILLSLHADALNEPTVRGASIYRLAPQDSDAQTPQLVSSNNSVISTGPRGPSEHPPGVSVILESLMFREKQLFSYELQHALFEALDEKINLLNNPVRHGHFLVLRSGSVPSLLLEMGFLSNADDERLLVNADYQDRLGAAIRDAVDQCIYRFAAASL